jgi:hypothetical protein
MMSLPNSEILKSVQNPELRLGKTHNPGTFWDLFATQKHK